MIFKIPIAIFSLVPIKFISTVINFMIFMGWDYLIKTLFVELL